MLRLLRIRNFALIRELEIEFDRGLNLLTGETGSGKSILVDALGLLLGERSSQEMIRTDCDTAILEALFEIDSPGAVSPILAASGFEAEDNSILVRREISLAGRNRVFINNNLATLSLLKLIGEKLADIHGQQDQRSLLELSTHLEWLDYFGGNGALLKDVREKYKRLRETARQLERLESNEQERLRRVDILQFQIEEIRRANLQPNEKEDLEHERHVLSNHEKIQSLATEAYTLLYESESSVLREINHLLRSVSELERFDNNWAVQREVLQEIQYKLEDLAYAARDCAARSESNPERLEHVHQRLHALEKLTKKYGASCSDILLYLEKCTRELETLISYSDSSARLSEQLTQESAAYLQDANKLSQKRQRDAQRLTREIRKEFAALAMERMEMQVHFHARKESETKGRLPGFYGLDGIDRVEFLIAPNRGEEVRALAKIASGGELSRLMLAIQSLCGNKEAGRTLVFDEVDAGIGGRVAEAVGRRLRDLSANCQVLCVTHLPQIAAFANHHLSVHKRIVGTRTETKVQILNDAERVQELSRMLGGETITQATRQHASEMLEYAARSERME